MLAQHHHHHPPSPWLFLSLTAQNCQNIRIQIFLAFWIHINFHEINEQNTYLHTFYDHVKRIKVRFPDPKASGLWNRLDDLFGRVKRVLRLSWLFHNRSSKCGRHLWNPAELCFILVQKAANLQFQHGPWHSTFKLQGGSKGIDEAENAGGVGQHTKAGHLSPWDPLAKGAKSGGLAGLRAKKEMPMYVSRALPFLVWRKELRISPMLGGHRWETFGRGTTKVFLQ